MEVCEIYRSDEDGNTIHQFVIDGLILPVLHGLPMKIQELQYFKPLTDDVFLFAFPKSGTHWTWEILNMLMSGSADHVMFGKDRLMFEMADLKHLEAQAPPRIINSHLPFRYIPKEILKNRNKIVHVVRNPKDVAVSCYNHHYNYKTWEYRGRWPAYLQLFLKGQVGWCFENEGWFGYEREWEKATTTNPDYPVLIVRYEDLHEDPISTVKRVAEFLGVTHDEEFYRKVVANTSFKVMSEAKNNFYSKEEKADWKNNEPKIFRKGLVGNWKQWFTVRQSETFDDIYKKEFNNASIFAGYQQR